MSDSLLEILYQDDYLVVINKPSGLLVHRTQLASQETDAVVQRLNAQLNKWVYPVHRLDRGTSGALVLAFDANTAKLLAEQFSQSQVEKYYLCLVRGHTESRGTIDYPLAKLNENKGKSRFKIEGTEKEAVTHYKKIEGFVLNQAVSKYDTTRCCLVEVKTEQGRKHQIRRHFKHIRFPLIGDTRYGCRHHNKLFRRLGLEQRLMLHAKTLAFKHPVTGHQLDCKASLPDGFKQTLDYLKSHTRP
ncbi:pseudouridine synthase Rlu family protein [Marinomonas sp. MED121]|uniref:pseudouridine synthase n=1 Tax=Marinomonas sp. MED121 TaxID=314277 RepID=UPI0000690B23|nr:pseudouridine synthase [Marinomonas sp. MED121]EAQ65920.1 pseudouridine synthase Rlu family protein [Marinomonas sp. MED121]